MRLIFGVLAALQLAGARLVDAPVDGPLRLREGENERSVKVCACCARRPRPRKYQTVHVRAHVHLGPCHHGD
jgi:hypothetical protein